MTSEEWTEIDRIGKAFLGSQIIADYAACEKERDDLRGALDIEVHRGMAYKDRAEAAEARCRIGPLASRRKPPEAHAEPGLRERLVAWRDDWQNEIDNVRHHPADKAWYCDIVIRLGSILASLPVEREKK